MPMIKRCCFSKNLRIGCIAAGIWSILYSIAMVGSAIFRIYRCYEDPENRYSSELEWSWVNFAIFFSSLLCGVLLIIGVLKDKACLLIPWMAMTVLLIIIDATSIIFSLIVDGLQKYLIFVLVLWILMTLIYIYSELCVLSHYQELKLGRGRKEDYMCVTSQNCNTPSAVHVHVTDGPVNYIQSQHTVYSFHSQTLYEDETKDQAIPCQVVGVPCDNIEKDTILGNVNGRVLELRPVTSLPSDMDIRFGSETNLRGSVEMKIVNSKPVIIDRRTGQISGQNGVKMSPVPGKMPKRFRTVSESAANRQPLFDDSGHATTNSLRNISGLSKLCEGSDVVVNTDGLNGKTTTSFTIGADGTSDQEQSLLSNQSSEDTGSDQSLSQLS